MADLNDVIANLATAVTASSMNPQSTWSTPEGLVGNGEWVYGKIADTELLTLSGNLTTRLCSLEVNYFYRFDTVANMETGEDTVNDRLEELTTPSYYSAFAAVRNSPEPEVEVTDPLERVGLTLTFTLTAQLALEV